MDGNILIGVIAFLGALVAGGVIMYQLFFSESDVDVRGLMNSSPRFSEEELADPLAIREQLLNDDTGEAAEKLKAQIRARGGKKGQLSLEEKFFQAGCFSDADKQIFYKQRKIAPIVGFVLGFFIVWERETFSLYISPLF